MELGIHQKDKSFPTAQEEQEDSELRLARLWQDFCTLPLRPERYLFDRWYLFVGIYYLFFLLVNVVVDINNYVSHPYYYNYYHESFITYLVYSSYVRGLLSDWIGLSWVLTVGLVVFFFNRWRYAIVGTFKSLYDRALITCKDCDLTREYVTFLEAYQKALTSKMRYIPGVIIFIVASSYFAYFTMLSINPLIQTNSFNADVSLASLFVNLLFALGCTYCISAGAWIMSVSSWYIRKLTIKFDFVIKPDHPDKSGGLRILGIFCFGIAFPILFAALLNVVYEIATIFFHKNFNLAFINMF